MQLRPTFDEFRALASNAGVVPVWRELLFDVDTAVTAYAKLARPPFGFLLESVVGGEQWARYTFLGSRPAAAWRLLRNDVHWWTPAGGWTRVEPRSPLDDLATRLAAREPAHVPRLPRLWSGAVGYFAYDIAWLAGGVLIIRTPARKRPMMMAYGPKRSNRSRARRSQRLDASDSLQ